MYSDCKNRYLKTKSYYHITISSLLNFSHFITNFSRLIVFFSIFIAIYCIFIAIFSTDNAILSTSGWTIYIWHTKIFSFPIQMIWILIHFFCSNLQTICARIVIFVIYWYFALKLIISYVMLIFWARNQIFAGCCQILA